MGRRFGTGTVLAGGLLLLATAVGLWSAAGREATVPGQEEATKRVRGALGHGAPALFRLIGRPTPAGTPQPVVISRDAAAIALRTGTLPIALPDGTRYDVRMEREEHAPGANWTVVGRVRTRVGPQAMVLTFGRDAVFGVLPRPDGRLLHVTTVHGNSRIALAGGLAPPGTTHARDYLVAGAKAPEGMGPPSQGAISAKSGGTAPVATARAATADPGTPTEITLLGIYTENLVALRGSAAAAETEFANLVAVANQAFLDGAIPVRLRVVGTHGISYPDANTNTQALTDLTWGDRPDTATIAPLRDSLQADLVAMLRPHHVDDPTCGIAWLNGGYLNPDLAMDTYGFSVSSVGEPCGPLVLPHELGHNLGSHHDRRTANSWSQEYGAYTFSFGHRQDGPASFATIMAYPEHRPWVAQFSNPRTSACGDACGTARHSDNARSIALMAPRIARFRGEPPGTVTIDDVEVLEPNNGKPGGVRFVVQSSTPAPAGGIGFDLVQAGGSATSGVDYRFAPQRGLVIAEGTRYAHLYVALEVVGDDAIEGDETIGVRLENVTGASAPDPTATVTIIDDDPRVQLTGHVFFPPDRRPLPDVPFAVCAEGGDGIPGRSDPSVCAEVDLSDMSYRIGVVPGSTVTLLASPPTPFADVQLRLGDVGADRRVDLVIPWGPVVSGRVVFPHGYPVPEEIIGFLYEDGNPHMLRMRAPEFRYGRAVAAGAWVTLELQPEGPWARYRGIVAHRLRQDATHDIRVGAEPTMILWTFPDQPEGVPGGTGTGEVVVELSEPAPFEGVRVDIAAVGGTATPGVDYRAEPLTLEFAPGERAKRFPFEWFGDDVFEGGETIVFQASNVRGANLVTPTMTVLIEDHRPTGGNQRPERP